MSATDNLRTLGWFVLCNAVAAMLLALRYLAWLSPPADAITAFYVPLAVLGHIPLLAMAAGLLVLPLVWLRPGALQSALIAAVATVALGVLAIDTLVFDQYRFHINAVVLNLLMSGQVVEFPMQTWVTVLAAAALLFTAQFALHRWLGRRVARLHRRYAKGLVLSIAVAALGSQAMHI